MGVEKSARRDVKGGTASSSGCPVSPVTPWVVVMTTRSAVPGMSMNGRSLASLAVTPPPLVPNALLLSSTSLVHSGES